MGIIIKAYPARNGDCFLVSFGTFNERKKHIIIDCGFASTYNEFLKNDLLEISNSGECIERLIITHIDSDHIQGAIKLLKDNNSKTFIEIKEIWHNTFGHLVNTSEQAIDKEQEQVLQQIIKRGNHDNEDEIERQVISAEQGTTVGALILKGNYSWNNDFDGRAVCIENKKEIKLDEETNLYLLSPDKQKLNRLQEFWRSELRKYGVSFEGKDSEFYNDAFEMLVSWEKEMASPGLKQISSAKEAFNDFLKRPFIEDQTIANGSSMAFILHIQKKRLLFLGDAHPGLVMQSLLEYQRDGQIMFDLVKVSHHGSFNNVSQELLDKIVSDAFLFSTNGEKHGHPHKETIAQILSRNFECHRRLYFNYMTDSAEYFNRSDWMKEYNYSIHYLNHEPFTLEL